MVVSRVRLALFPTVTAWKAYVVVIVAALLPAAIIAAAGVPQFGAVERLARERELRSICRLLELESIGSLELMSAGQSSPEEQAWALHAALQPVVDRVCAAYSEIEAGYYSRALGLEVAMGRGAEARPLFAQRPPEDFRVYRTGRPETASSSGSRGIRGAPASLTHMRPLYRGDDLVGHVWASVEVRQFAPAALAAATGVVAASAASAVAMLVAAWWLMKAVASWEREAAARRAAAAHRQAAEVVQELRNPISVARGLAQIVMSEEDDPRCRMWMGNLVRQLDYMSSVAADYLRGAFPDEASAPGAAAGETRGELQCRARPGSVR